ncbi:MAG: hypothetical protein IJM72_04105, partial [Deltaproteobacteria bacterium]|nr:hypothetical protein [Deltaproteobacteria bacterium]
VNRSGCWSAFTGSSTGSGFEKSLMKEPGRYWDEYGSGGRSSVLREQIFPGNLPKLAKFAEGVPRPVPTEVERRESLSCK